MHWQAVSLFLESFTFSVDEADESQSGNGRNEDVIAEDIWAIPNDNST
jgi:hypothetical protein